MNGSKDSDNNTSNSCENRRIWITLQFGSFKDFFVIERDDRQVRESFYQRIKQIISKQSDGKLDSNVEYQLFRHDHALSNVLQRVDSISQLDNGSMVDIILTNDHERPTLPHKLNVMSYKTPTFCDYCGEILVGLIKQGLQCSNCRCNFHKKCSFAPRNNCAKSAVAEVPDSGRTVCSNRSAYALPHTLAVHNFTTLTVCKVCDKMLIGLMKQGLRCRDCKVNVHKRCAPFLPINCRLADGVIMPFFDQMSVNDAELGVNVGTSRTCEEEHVTNEESLIPLARLPGHASVRGFNQQPLAEGWMIHFTLSQPDRRLRHYWILSGDSLNMYSEYNNNQFVKNGVNPHRAYCTIPLGEILVLTRYKGPPIHPSYPQHYFEIRTISHEVYYCGENLDAYGAPPQKQPKYGDLRPLSNVSMWFNALKQALQPPTSTHGNSTTETTLKFSEIYQINREQSLGSGQFGVVYGGIHRQSGREVAVKIIDKDRFAKRSATCAETLRSEVAILQTISYPGIIRVESMFETTDKIFVVMEKMSGDMLEMILSQAAGRLDERATKFLIVQILCALKYLHGQGIAHCDLKPENVLLSDYSAFPQTKLCDFGYARFIGDAQFRKTIVGTPAYLAPEVLEKRGYNRSLDMWSLGVIIYVTLSGAFPFNEGEEISEQIQNAAFMFPDDTWNAISNEAVDLIRNLLKVKIDERFTIEQCFAHHWLQDDQACSDLKNLEGRMRCGRYLTDEKDGVEFVANVITRT